MHDNLKVALIQSDLVWEDPAKNRDNFSKKIQSITEPVDVVVLPEMFTTGFTMNANKVAESMEGETVAWMKELASQTNAAIAGSIIILEQGKFYNRFLFVDPSGKVSAYDKRHTFTLAGEEKTFASGKEKVIVDYKGWKICPMVCYDLRFPVWARNVEDYDVLIYVANWPKPRINAWDTLLQARAIENMCYCIGVNRVGIDGINIEYSGHSGAYDVLGNPIAYFKSFEDGIKIAKLEQRHIVAYRNKLKFLNDRDSFKITR
ncbi:amidohydrolase [Tamlana flava]|uniref:amidohydrolase n=1 Tax=Tamlana flava TaxID=3158572 RepID=UPI00351B33C1